MGPWAAAARDTVAAVPPPHQQEPSGAKPPDADKLTGMATLGKAMMLRRPQGLLGHGQGREPSASHPSPSGREKGRAASERLALLLQEQ